MASEWDERNAPAVAYAESIIGPIIEQRDAARAEAARYREALDEIAHGTGTVCRWCRCDRSMMSGPAHRDDCPAAIARAALAHQDGSDEK